MEKVNAKPPSPKNIITHSREALMRAQIRHGNRSCGSTGRFHCLSRDIGAKMYMRPGISRKVNFGWESERFFEIFKKNFKYFWNSINVKFQKKLRRANFWGKSYRVFL